MLADSWLAKLIFVYFCLQWDPHASTRLWVCAGWFSGHHVLDHHCFRLKELTTWPFGQNFYQKHDQYLGFDFLLIRISRKILKLKLVENWLKACCLFWPARDIISGPEMSKCVVERYSRDVLSRTQKLSRNVPPMDKSVMWRVMWNMSGDVMIRLMSRLSRPGNQPWRKVIRCPN